MEAIFVAAVLLLSFSILAAVSWAIYFDKREMDDRLSPIMVFREPAISQTLKREQKTRIIEQSSDRSQASGRQGVIAKEPNGASKVSQGTLIDSVTGPGGMSGPEQVGNKTYTKTG